MGIFSKKSVGTGPTANTTKATAPTAVAARTNVPTNGSPPSKIAHAGGSGIPSLSPPDKGDADEDPNAYLKSLPAIRERSLQVFAQRHRLRHFMYQESSMKNVVSFVLAIIKRDYGTDYKSIPAHGRWQHFEVGGRRRIDELLLGFASIDTKEKTRRVIDLFLVSVLLDAGAGNKWTYKAKNGKIYRRSEGLAVASLEMFERGLFSSDSSVPTQVDAIGLSRLTTEALATGLQVSGTNPMSGLEGRSQLLIRLSHALSNNREIFGSTARPGYMIDYLLAHPSGKAFAGGHVVSTTVLWSVLTNGLSSIWPDGRTKVRGASVGDAWPSSALPTTSDTSNIIPFHKLTQWLAYSLMAPMTKLLNIQFAHSELLTGLPEYRNGGLFIDLGVLTLKTPDSDRGRSRFIENGKIAGQQNSEVIPLFDPSDDVIVEWRAMTICLLDQIHKEINRSLNLTGLAALSLPQVLEAGTWKAGREIAEVQRPNTRGSPIGIVSDGTVF